MATAATGKDIKLGFLTVIEMADRGFMGGLLVTTLTGRPLEFQCTTPVQPNKTQQILYGTTLGPFIKGELIAKTLLERVQIKPVAILVDQLDILGLRNHIDTPVAVLKTDDTTGKPNDAEHAKRNHNRNELYALKAFSEDLAIIAEMLKGIPAEADLGEPLYRTNEALRETLKTAA
jgi:hypothetical protein